MARFEGTSLSVSQSIPPSIKLEIFSLIKVNEARLSLMIVALAVTACSDASDSESPFDSAVRLFSNPTTDVANWSRSSGLISLSLVRSFHDAKISSNVRVVLRGSSELTMTNVSSMRFMIVSTLSIASLKSQVWCRQSSSQVFACSISVFSASTTRRMSSGSSADGAEKLVSSSESGVEISLSVKARITFSALPLWFEPIAT